MSRHIEIRIPNWLKGVTKKYGITCNQNGKYGSIYSNCPSPGFELCTIYVLNKFNTCLVRDNLCSFCPSNPFRLDYDLNIKCINIDFRLMEV